MSRSWDDLSDAPRRGRVVAGPQLERAEPSPRENEVGYGGSYERSFARSSTQGIICLLREIRKAQSAHHESTVTRDDLHEHHAEVITALENERNQLRVALLAVESHLYAFSVRNRLGVCALFLIAVSTLLLLIRLWCGTIEITSPFPEFFFASVGLLLMTKYLPKRSR